MDENSRIAIVITGPGDNISAQFKMRGKHQIKKILKTACQNFDLDFDRYSNSLFWWKEDSNLT